MTKRRELIFLVVLFLIQALIVCINGKSNFHVDELYTYGLSNNVGSTAPIIEDGMCYTGMGPYTDYLTVDGGGQYNYSNVWVNQANDVHPPLYYIFIHTICSFFPGVFTKWFGIFFNLVCLFFIDLLFYKLSVRIIQSEWMGMAATAVNGLAYLTLNMIVFIRMYALMTVCVLAVLLLMIVYMDRERYDGKFWLTLYLVSVAGTMTQYYFLIFLFWVCLFWGVRLLRKRRWKDVVCYLLCLGTAGVSCIAIFPAMLDQIFGDGYRGVQAFENAKSMGNFFTNLKGYCTILNDSVYGGWFWAFAFLCVLLLALGSDREGLKRFLRAFNERIALLAVGAAGYILVIVKIAPYITDRYIMPVGWITILLSIWVLSQVLAVSEKAVLQTRSMCGLCVVFCVLALAAYHKADWTFAYSYKWTEGQLETAQEHKNHSVVYVYDTSWKTCSNMLELMKYRDYTFAKQENLSEILEGKSDEESLVVYIINSLDNDRILQQILESNEHLTTYDSLYSLFYANVYYLQ